MAEQFANGSRGSVWGPRLSRLALRLALAALAVAAIGLTLARYDLIAKLAGFSALLGGGLIALGALVLGLCGLVAARGKANPERGKGLTGIVIGLIFLGFLASRPLTAGDIPKIHDVTTDVANPPQFEVLPLRADNLAGVGTEANWRKLHAAAYGRLTAITVAKPVAAVTADAVRLAKESGWEIAASDPARGHVEATASVSYIRFKDDVVIRIVPTADGQQSRVDMRSVSRVGISDFGVNAKRIEAFLAALAKA